jgi:hypothetical protein
MPRVRSNEIPLFTKGTFTINVQHLAAVPVDQSVALLQRRCKLIACSYMNVTPDTAVGAVNVMPRKCTGAQAVTAGAALLTNNTAAGFNCKGTTLVEEVGDLVGSDTTLTFEQGDRLAHDFAGVTDLAGVLVSYLFANL